MLFLKDTTPMKIYKRPFYLPTRETEAVPDKKTGSIIFLLTPNRTSSLQLMMHPLTINKLRYQSYYFEKNLTYFLNLKGEEQEDDIEESYVRDIRPSTYITEADSDTKVLQDNFNISGDKKSVDFFIENIVPELSEKIKDVVEDLNTSYPEIDIQLASIFDVNEDFYFNLKDDYGKKIISITLPAYRGDETVDSYKNRICNYIVKCIMIAKDTRLATTIIPKAIADYITDADSREAEYGEFLLKDKDDLFDKIQHEDYRSIVRSLVDEFHIDRDTFFYDDGLELNEAKASPITMENLGDRFKYLTTSKIKKKFTEARSKVKRDLEKTYFTPYIEIPYVGAPGGDQSTQEGFNLYRLKENQDYITVDENNIMLLEDALSDNYLRRFLYKDRIKKRSIINNINKQIKVDDTDIRYAYLDLNQYKKKNLFVDLYYFNETFFKNYTLNPRKGLTVYIDLLDKLINDKRYTQLGYTKRTVFLPVFDWNTNPRTRMWMYTEQMNPVSVIYQLMLHNPDKLRGLFKNIDFVFFDNTRFFRINFNDMTSKQLRQTAPKFRMFINKFCDHTAFDPEDEDNNQTDTPEAIKTDIYDKIEASKGIDLTGKEKEADPVPENPVSDTTKHINNPAPTKPKTDKEIQNINVAVNAPTVSKLQQDISTSAKKEVKKEIDNGTVAKSVDKDTKVRKEEETQKLAKMIDNASKDSNSSDEALDKLDLDRDKIINMMNNIQSVSANNINISTTRAARINNLANDLLDQKINNRTVKDMLEEDPDKEKIPEMKLNIASPNPEWKDLTYVNFDKNYDLDRDIVNCFAHFATCSYPLSIVKINAEDTSTSEDRVETYSVQYEDMNGKRFSVKLDIPIMKDNRFLLRGNAKVIATQFLNMPILKTDLGAAQVITNYQKIFIYRSTTKTGSSNSLASRIIKALKKYNGNNIVVTTGDNSRVCNKYQLPIDYIDFSTVINMIENKKTGMKWYFNQDEIRKDFPNQVVESNGVPVGYDTKKKAIVYKTNMSTTFAQDLLNDLFVDDEFRKKISNIPSSKGGVFSQCSVLDERIPLVLVASFRYGLSALLKRAKINYEWKDTLTREDRYAFNKDYVIFKNGYLLFDCDDYASNLLLNGLKELPTAAYNMGDMDKKDTYIDFLENYGGRIKADGLDNFYDCLVDPITKEVLEHYHLPTNFVDILLYANALMADNKYIRHTDTSSRRIRREEMVAAYTYEALTEAYAIYANAMRRGSSKAIFSVKQSTVIDKLLQSPISQDDSINNALGAVEETNNISFKGKSGLNSERSYSLDKRTYDDSMVNVLGQSTNFSASVGINRAATIDMNIEGPRGYIKQNNGDTSTMNTAKTLTATEALVPFEVNSDDSGRIGMTYLQTAKHMVRTVKSDPPLVTNGADQALPYLTTDTFAFKAKQDGKVLEITDTYMIVQYKDGTKDYIDLKTEIKKNSDGGYYVPLKLSADETLKVGSSFVANQILAYDHDSFSRSLGESDNLAYNIGKLAKVAIITTDDGFEDSGVCTRKLADDLTTKVIYEFEHVIEKDSLILEYKKVGDVVNVGDSLIVWQDAFENGEDINTIMKVLSKTGVDASTLGRRVVESKTTGRIAGIKVFRTCELDDMSESVRKFVEEYEKPIEALKSKLDEEGINTKTLPATYKLKPTGKLKKAQDAIYIEYYIEHDDKVGVGDKGTYLAANKFTLKSIIPNDKSPYTDFRPNEQVSAFLSVSSINHRMVTSIIKNGVVNKLMVELDRSVKDMLGIPYDVNNL